MSLHNRIPNIKENRKKFLSVVLYGRKTWSLILRRENSAFKHRKVTILFPLRKDEGMAEWRKLHNEKLHNLRTHELLLG